MAITLGPRLNQISLWVPQGAKLGDIGTDHAYLPITLCEQGIIPSAVAVDIHKGPYESAKAAVTGLHLENRISVRLGNGLLPVLPGEVDTLTIAGMGGNTILDILSGRPDVLAKVEKLILQPQGAEGKVRKALLKQGWYLEDEVLVEEDGKVYVIMGYVRQNGWSFTDVEQREQEWITAMLDKPEVSEQLKNPTHQELFSERAKALFWQFGPLVLQRGGVLVERLLDERLEALGYRLKEMQKGKSETVGTRIKEAEIELNAVKALSTIIQAQASSL